LTLFSLLKKEDFYWLCISRVDTIDEDLAQEMYDAGCREVEFGIESGSQKILDSMNKGTTVEQNKDAIKSAKSAGIKVRALMMEEYPTENDDDIELSKKFLIETQPDIVSLFSFVANPGSRDYIKYRSDSIGRRYFYPEIDSDFKRWIKNDVWKKN
jgi:anaerobic magnesium-protoporphyrin IX monomethyl ester cyclase